MDDGGQGLTWRRILLLLSAWVGHWIVRHVHVHVRDPVAEIVGVGAPEGHNHRVEERPVAHHGGQVPVLHKHELVQGKSGGRATAARAVPGPNPLPLQVAGVGSVRRRRSLCYTWCDHTGPDHDARMLESRTIKELGSFEHVLQEHERVGGQMRPHEAHQPWLMGMALGTQPGQGSCACKRAHARAWPVMLGTRTSQ